MVAGKGNALITLQISCHHVQLYLHEGHKSPYKLKPVFQFKRIVVKRSVSRRTVEYTEHFATISSKWIMDNYLDQVSSMMKFRL